MFEVAHAKVCSCLQKTQVNSKLNFQPKYAFLLLISNFSSFLGFVTVVKNLLSSENCQCQSMKIQLMKNS